MEMEDGEYISSSPFFKEVYHGKSFQHKTVFMPLPLELASFVDARTLRSQLITHTCMPQN